MSEKIIRLYMMRNGDNVMAEDGGTFNDNIKLIRPIMFSSDLQVQAEISSQGLNGTMMVMVPWIPSSIVKEDYAIIPKDEILCDFTVYEDVLEHYITSAKKLYKPIVIKKNKPQDKTTSDAQELIQSLINPTKKDLN